MKGNILVMCMAGAALAVSAPTLAKPGGGGGMGGGAGGGYGHGLGGGFGTGFDVRTQARVHSQGPYYVSPTGRAHANSHSVLYGTTRGTRYHSYGHNACPRGLVSKHNGCLPPGQASKIFTRGQRLPPGYQFYTRLNNIPLTYRNQIPGTYLNGNYNYIYRGNTIYVVNPTTRMVADILAF
jgi:hypothetical protein